MPLLAAPLLACATAVAEQSLMVEAARSPVPAGGKLVGLLLHDVNPDGVLDAVGVLADSGCVGVLIGDGRGGFRRAPGPAQSPASRHRGSRQLGTSTATAGSNSP